MKNTVRLLEEWGQFVCGTIDYADEYGENILYRAGLMQGRVQEATAGDTILCPDMPAHIKRVENAVKRLPPSEYDCVVMFYCAPLKDDGNTYSVADLAHLLGVTSSKFRRKLKKGVGRLKYLT